MSKESQFSESHNPADKKGPTFNPNEAAKASHPVVVEDEKIRSSGRDVGLPHPSLVSVNPTSKQANETAKVDYDIVDNSNDVMLKNTDNKFIHSNYPFGDLEAGQGIFIKIPDGKTTDEVMEKSYKDIHAANEYFSETARDENGDEILEQLIIKERKRNDDGSLQLEGDGKLIVGANSVQRPKKIYLRQYVAKAIVKNDEIGKGKKAESDGVLIIRVF